MKERIRDDVFEVYPFLDEGATEREIDYSDNYVIGFLDEGQGRIRVHVDIAEGLNQEQTRLLFAAINRAWEWVGEQLRKEQLNGFY